MRAVVVMVGLMVAGCFDPHPVTGLPCSTAGDCPEPLVCSNDVCVAAPTPDPDASGDAPFDSPPGTVDAGLSDGAGPPDASGLDSAFTAGDRCDNAIPFIATVGATIAGTMVGANDDYDPIASCPAADGVEVVYVFTPPSEAVRGFAVNASFTGRWYTHTSCPPTSFFGCSGISSMGGVTITMYPAQPIYFVIERDPMSPGTAFEIIVTD